MDIALNDSELDAFYRQYFYYYNTLDVNWQRKFVKRAIYFMNSKVIMGADGFQINNKVRAIVSASAVQLTLGLDTWDYDYFLHIIIHPRIYTDQHTNLQFKGETNLQGHIRLSWLSFINGYKDQHDNINLGIHEFTHALRFNGIRGNEQDYYMRYFFIRWLNTAYEAYADIRSGKENIFRRYGGANIHEFTSVCFEHFFESPQQIKEHYPHLFYNTAVLLNQCTFNEKTKIEIREQMLIEKNNILEPLNSCEIKQDIKSESSVPLIIISAAILLITALKIGFFTGPSLILFFITLFFYFRLEHNFMELEVDQKTITITKGYLMAKRWHRQQILLSQVVNLQYNINGLNTDLVFVYYNFDDKHFYEESLQCDSAKVHNLIQELKQNKIAINRID